MKPFRLKQCTILQKPEVFKVGTDALLLGSLADVQTTRNLLEVGAGCGVVSLMLAQKQPLAQILAIDIQPEAAELSQLNFQLSPFSLRLKAENISIQNLSPTQKFDSLVCNPPFYESTSMLHSSHAHARQQITLDFHDLFLFGKELITPSGNLQLIYPYKMKDEVRKIAEKHRLYANRIVEIKGNPQSNWVRVFGSFSFTKEPSLSETLTLETQRGKFTQEYLQLTQAFHCFSSNKA